MVIKSTFSPVLPRGGLAGWLLHGRRRLSWQKVKASKDSAAKGEEKKARVAQPKPRRVEAERVIGGERTDG